MIQNPEQECFVPILRSVFALLILVLVSACSSDSKQSSEPADEDSPFPVATSVDSVGTPWTIPQSAAGNITPPASEWLGIPIMPGAITGDGDEDGYVFLIQSTVDRVRAFYETELPKNGWQSLPSDDDLTLLYVKTDDMATLMINLITKDNMVMVLFSR
jgi:hypothetical protein